MSAVREKYCVCAIIVNGQLLVHGFCQSDVKDNCSECQLTLKGRCKQSNTFGIAILYRQYETLLFEVQSPTCIQNHPQVFFCWFSVEKCALFVVYSMGSFLFSVATISPHISLYTRAHKYLRTLWYGSECYCDCPWKDCLYSILVNWLFS